ncbi:MAG: hypothetical protein FJ005_06300 [Chloroflexi bacterium]|nr:hypothetical protein [Chloroflexota bacterium]
MKKGFCVSVLLLVTVLILPTACKAPPEPAQFEVLSLDIIPPTVIAGDTVTVTARVKNTGGSDGIYTATLTVDGAQVETKDITVTPGATETVNFSLARDKAGTYQVAIGELRSSLTVKPKLVAKEVELKYDNDKPYEYLVSVDGGWLVDFLPPVTPFTIQKIRLFGSRGSQERTFELEIWDKDHKVLFKEAYPSSKFPIGKSAPGNENLAAGATWVELEVPNIEVADRFYVHIWNGSSFWGTHLGADSSVKNEHSAITIRTTGITKEVESWGQSNFCLCWTFLNWSKPKVNWMIRVVGIVMVPEE